MADPSLVRLTVHEILAGLNDALLAERQAVADYDLHARTSSRPEIREALETLRDVEQEHAGRLAARIRALGCTPSGETPEPKPAGDALTSRLAQDLIGEQWAIVEYARLVAGIVDDDETVELMAELLRDEIRHAAWLKATLRAL
jgi:bacterioferritin (cytochrome b1)